MGVNLRYFNNIYSYFDLKLCDYYEIGFLRLLLHKNKN